MPSTLGHLQIEAVRLHPGQEHLAAAGSWRFVLVQSGAAYWLDGERTRPLDVGEMLVLGPKINASIRQAETQECAPHLQARPKSGQESAQGRRPTAPDAGRLDEKIVALQSQNRHREETCQSSTDRGQNHKVTNGDQ